MSKTIAIDRKETGVGHAGLGPPPGMRRHGFHGGDNGRNGGSHDGTRNAVVAMLLFIGADVMFFAGLLGALVVFRFGAENWPPPDQPRLPLGVTTANTLVLLTSGLAMLYTWRKLRGCQHRVVRRGLAVTTTLGVVFLLIQGYEWTRLLAFGLRLSTGVFGATFYTLIGCHALHVIGAVVWMLVVLFRIRSRNPSLHENGYLSVKLAGMYWYLVVGLWPVIYGLVYLS